MKFVRVIGLFALSILAVAAWGEEGKTPSILISYDRSEMKIGDFLTVSIKVFSEQECEVEWPSQIWPNSTDWVQLNDHLYKPKALKDKRIMYRHDYVVTTYTVGSKELEPIKLTYQKEGLSGDLNGEKAHIEVLSVIKDGDSSQDIRDLKGIYQLKRGWTGWLVAAVLLVLLAGAWRLMRRKKKAVLLESDEVVISAEEQALKDLNRLMKEDLSLSAETYFQKLSFVVRRYLEDRYEILALESTSSEILKDLKKIKLERDLLKNLEELLHCSDLAKFAKYDVSDLSQKQHYAELAIKMVRATKRQQESSKEGA